MNFSDFGKIFLKWLRFPNFSANFLNLASTFLILAEKGPGSRIPGSRFFATMHASTLVHFHPGCLPWSVPNQHRMLLNTFKPIIVTGLGPRDSWGFPSYPRIPRNDFLKTTFRGYLLPESFFDNVPKKILRYLIAKVSSLWNDRF